MKMKTDKEFDKMFDDGDDISAMLDLSKARRGNLEHKRVNVDFPAWMIDKLDRKARRLGIPRQSLIKTLIARYLDSDVA